MNLEPVPVPVLPSPILLVEDDPVQLRVWETLARRYGMTLVTTPRTTEVLRLALTHRPQLIVLDLVLEDGHSMRVLRTLKESPETWDLPVVVVSGYLSPEVEEGIESFGDVPVLRKPWELQELLPFLARASPPPTP